MARPATMTSRAGMMGVGGSRYEDEGGMRGGSRLKGETCYSSKPGPVHGDMCKEGSWRGRSGEMRVRRDLPQ